MRRALEIICLILVCLFAEHVARGADVDIPAQVTAGTDLLVHTTGSGDATLYLVGPGTALKRSVKLGDAVKIEASELRDAGQYFYVLRGSEQSERSFMVVPAKPANIAFLARPSRVPASHPGVISGVAFLFDANNNLVTAPTIVKFELSVAGDRPVTREIQSREGIAFTQLDSGKQAGAAQFTAYVDQVSVRRVVQEVAADPCNLRMRAQPGKNGILVETDPIRDCSGNPVPDGTIVTFTSVDPNGRSTIDARIKKGIATAELPNAQTATLSVAAGVVVGNEIRWGGSR